tara:strand:+ start:222 stop:446 length:225 start_codon:yes stop_codon:yes gene_type:complete
MNKTIVPRGTTKPVKLIPGEKWTVVGSQIHECWWEFEMTPEIKKEIISEAYNGDVNKWRHKPHHLVYIGLKPIY